MHEDVQAVPDEGSNISFVEWETGTVMEVERKKQQREKMSTALLYLKQVGTGKEYTEKEILYLNDLYINVEITYHFKQKKSLRH